MGSECIFCGQLLKKVTKSKEHIFPAWILNRLGISNTNATGIWFSSIGVSRSQRTQSFGSILLGNICRSCNNGWMSILEQKVKSVFLQAFSSSSDNLVLSRREAMDLAAWVLKTAIVLNLGTNYRKLFGRQLIRSLYLRHCVPKSCYVDVIYHASKSDIAWRQSQQIIAFMPGELKKNIGALTEAFRVTMRIGPLTFRYCYIPQDLFYCRSTNTNAVCISKPSGSRVVIGKMTEVMDIDKHDLLLYLDWRRSS